MSSVGQGLSRLLGYATQVALAWMYGPTQLGFYVLGMTLVQITNVLSQFGMDNGVVRYVAHYQAEGDARRVRGTIVQALSVTFVLSVALSILLFLGAGFLAERIFDRLFLETVIRTFSVSVPFFTVMSMALWATQGFQTVKYQTYVQDVVRPVLNLAFIAVFYLLGVEVLGAVAAYILSMAFGAVLALYYLKKVFPNLLNSSVKPKFESRALFEASGPMIVASFIQQVNSWMALLVLWAFTGALAFFLITTLLARDIMMVFGAEFVWGWPVIVIIAAAQLFSSSVGPTARVLAMTGHQRMVMFATLGSAVAAAALNLLLVPLFGIFGAAAATAAAMILVNMVTMLLVHRLLGFWPYSSRYTKPIVAGLLAAACVYLARLVLPVYAGVSALPVFAPLFLAVFLALLVSLGLSPSDRHFLASFWAAFLRNVRPTRRDA